MGKVVLGRRRRRRKSIFQLFTCILVMGLARANDTDNKIVMAVKTRTRNKQVPQHCGWLQISIEITALKTLDILLLLLLLWALLSFQCMVVVVLLVCSWWSMGWEFIIVCLKESFLLLAPTTLLPGIWIHKTPTHPKKTLLKQKEKTDNPDQDNEQQSLHWVYMGLWKERKRERERRWVGLH